MREIRLWIIVALTAVAGVIVGPQESAAEPTPEEVVGARGLTRAGLLYVLDDEKEVLRGIAKIEPRYSDVEALYLRLDAIVRNQTTYDALDRDYVLITQRYRDVGAEIDAFPTTSNSELKQQYRNLLDLEKQLRLQRNELNSELDLRYKTLVPDWKREELFTQFQAKRKDFLAESRNLRAQAEEIKTKYATLARDEAVKKAIAGLRISTKTRVDLGPSPEFKKKTALLKNAERTFAFESVRRKTRSRKNSQKASGDAAGSRATPSARKQPGNGKREHDR